ncbi:MAG: EAL domain-containing protein [Oleiphilaceae bacterium]|nr:EAL domain-containing protein [Oleiphilaceae bacterium]
MSEEEFHNKRSLEQVLALFVGALLLLLLLGSFAVNVFNMRSYLEQQLQSHAQDAATSLGLSLSTVVDARDLVLAERMIAAIFDSGDYQQIIYRGLEGETLLRFDAEAPVESVPGWFTQWVSLEAPRTESQVMSGWNQLGTLEVQSHAGYAYLELWRLARNQLGFYFLVALVSLLLMHAMLKYVLRPLQRMEDQAHAMASKQFDQRAPIPPTRELAKVASAMNGMADTLGKVFGEQLALIESLRAQSMLDNLTGLNNREGFDRRLRTELESQDRLAQGSLLLIQLFDFGSVNQRLGRDEADLLLKAVAAELSALVRRYSGAFAARRNGADFSLFVPGVAADAIEDVAAHLLSRLCALQQVRQLLRDDIVHIGVACVSDEDDARSLLSKADMALTQAQGKGISGWQRYARISGELVLDEVRQATEWHAFLQRVLAEESLVLHAQPVYRCMSSSLLFHQVLVRIEEGGELLAASMFLPMAERFQLISQFDRLVVKKVVASLDGHASSESHSYGISLSEHSIADEDFLQWLQDTLSQHSEVVSRLMFEVPEHVVHLNEEGLHRLSQMGRELGFRVIIERFGVASVPFAYLQRVNLNAIKIDHSFVRDIHENPDNQFFVRSAVQIAHSQGVQLIAVGVESEEELQKLAELGIDGAMGYHLGRPERADVLA